MSSIWGDNLKISLFGESHGAGVGVVIDGMPAGVKVDFEFVEAEMKRRAPGSGNTDGLVTSRKEPDKPEVLSGIHEENTTGSPICVIVRNTNTKSEDYKDFKNIPRPSHADYTGTLRYNGMNDIRGGGHFSARVTAGLVFAGALAKLVLKDRDIHIGSHLKSVHTVEDISFDNNTLSAPYFSILRDMRIPVINEFAGRHMEEAILSAKLDKDSVGGVIETAVIGFPAGCGNPFFDSVESKLAHMLYSIPGVKGVEFGAGFDISQMYGSDANDTFYFDDGIVKTKTNHSGGINGGITNGMPIVFKTALKPTPSIAMVQDTVDLKNKKDTMIEIGGRHDPCIAVRAVPIVEAATAICMLDVLL